MLIAFSSFDFPQALTLSVAVLGAALGIINTWDGLQKNKVKLRVVPKQAIPLGALDERLTFCIEVTNLSVFAVTVYDVGVFYYGTDSRGSFVNPFLIDKGGWPRRLEPRSSVTVYGQNPTSHNEHKIRCAYARTECGHTQTGMSPALKKLSEQSQLSS